MESKYLARFKNVDVSSLPLRGNRLLVEVLPKLEIKTGSGLIIKADMEDHRTSTAQNQADLAIVLAVGSGYYDDDTGADVEMDIKPGAVILISRMGLKLYSVFPGLSDYTKETIALTRDNEVHAAWESVEAFQAYTTKLNG